MSFLASVNLQTLTNHIEKPWAEIIVPQPPSGPSGGPFFWLWNAIRSIFGTLGKVIVSGFTIAFGAIIWSFLVQGPLLFLRSLLQTFRFLSGGFVVQLIFGSDNTFSWNKLPYVFIGMVIVAGSLVVVFFIINTIIAMCKKHEQFIASFKKSLMAAALSAPAVLIIPVLFFIFAVIMEQVSTLLISGGVFGKGSTTIPDVLYNIGAKAKSYEHDFSKDSPLTPFNYAAPSDLSHWNFFVEIIVVIVSTIMILLITIAVFTKIMEIFFLFIISPLVISTWTIDGGARLIIWKNHTIAKFLAMSASIFGVYIFAIVLGQVINIIEGLNMSWDTKTTLKIAAIIGCTTAMPSFGALISSFVSEKAEATEGRSAIRNSLALGKALLAGGAYIGGAIGAIDRALIGSKGMYSVQRFFGRNPAKIGNRRGNNNSLKTHAYNGDNSSVNGINNASEEVEKMIGIGGLAGVGLGLGKIAFHTLKHIRHPKRYHRARKENVKEYQARRAEMMGKKVENLGFWEKVTLKRDANRIFRTKEWLGKRKSYDNADIEYATFKVKKQEVEEKQKAIDEENRINDWLKQHNISKTTWQRAGSMLKNKEYFKKYGIDLEERTQEEVATTLHEQEIKHAAESMSNLKFDKEKKGEKSS